MEQKITCLVKGLEEHLSNPTWIIARTKDYPGPTGVRLTPRCLQHPSHPLPFGCKRSLNSNSGKMVLGDTSQPSSWSGGFLNKVSIPCLTLCPLLCVGAAQDQTR